MKITKRQLSRIIKEEKAKLLEQPGQMSFNQPHVDYLRDVIKQLEVSAEQLFDAARQAPDARTVDELEDIEAILSDTVIPRLEKAAEKLEKTRI